MERQLNDWLDGYLRYMKNTEPPDLYNVWVGISVIASCLRRKCFLHWNDLVYPNLYIVLVGPSGCRKGTAMKPGSILLNSIGLGLAPKSASREALIEHLIAGFEQVNDPATNLPLPHCSMTVYSEEFTVFIGEKNLPLLMALTDWYDCPDIWPYSTISRGEETISGVWVNLIAATTPDLLQRTLTKEATGGGLTGRIIFVCAARKGRSVPLPFDRQSDGGEELFGKLRADLERIKMLVGRFKVSESFIDRWVTWYEENDSKPPFRDHRLEPYVSRKATHLLKMCMILNASHSNNMIIDVNDLERAINILQLTEIPMEGVFGGIGDSVRASTIDRLRRVIESDKEIHFNTLMNMFILDVDSKKDLMLMLMDLEAAGFCVNEEVRDDKGRLKDFITRYKG